MRHENEFSAEQRQIDQAPPLPDHVRDGRTLPEQIEGDHAYRDEPPRYDPSLWATHKLTCLVCGTDYPDAPAGERAERLDNGQLDTGHCPECDRKTPAYNARAFEYGDGIPGVYVVRESSHCCSDHGSQTYIRCVRYTEEAAEEMAEGPNARVEIHGLPDLLDAL